MWNILHIKFTIMMFSEDYEVYFVILCYFNELVFKLTECFEMSMYGEQPAIH